MPKYCQYSEHLQYCFTETLYFSSVYPAWDTLYWEHQCQTISSPLRVFFLPVDTQHTRCPCRFFLLETQRTSSVVMKQRQRDSIQRCILHRCSQHLGVKLTTFKKNIIQALRTRNISGLCTAVRVLRVFRDYLLRNTAGTRSIWWFITTDTSGHAVFRGSILWILHALPST